MTKPARNISLGFTDEPFPEGTHMCLFYSDEQERVDVISRFMQAGLRANEQVCYFAKSLLPEELVKNLNSLGIDISDEDTARQLLCATSESAYYPNGRFDPDSMLATLRAFYSASMEEGFSGVRGIGEMEWALEDIPGSDRLIEYEMRVNMELKNTPLTSICQYNINLFDGKTIMDILRLHPAVILRGRITRNPFYSSPDAFKTSGG